jgi:hypothetical protein
VARKFRPTIWKSWNAKGVISITDQLNIQQFLFIATERGKDTVKCYVDFKRALAIANAILNGRFSYIWPSNSTNDSYDTTGRMVIYGGAAKSKQYNGRPESRVFEIEAIKDKSPRAGVSPNRFILTIKVGEGVLGDSGAIKPKDSKQMLQQKFFISAEVAYEMASILHMHVEQYYGHYMSEMYDEEEGDYKHGTIDDMYKAEYRPTNENAVTPTNEQTNEDITFS